MRKKSPTLTKAQYVDLFIIKARRLFKDMAWEVAEEMAHKLWIGHRDTNFKYLETADKDAEMEWLWANYKPD